MLSRVLERTWVTPLTAVSFAAVAITGILMWLHVRVPAIRELHELLGLVFAVAGVVHLTANWRAFIAYFRRPWATASCAASCAASVLAAVLLCLVLIFANGGEPGHYGGNGHRHHAGGPPTESDGSR